MTSRSISGICNICGNEMLFENVDPVRPRESFRCTVCSSNSRMRLFIYTIGLFFGYHEPLSMWKENKNIKMFEASGVGKYSSYLGRVFDYINTKYDPEVIKTKDFDLLKYADLQKLHFDDASFDMVITTDVLEHVRLYKDALKEVYRVLKPEGIFILQIPYNHSMENTIERVELKEDGNDIMMLPPRYHAGNTLVYRDYGLDFLRDVSDTGFSVGYLKVELPKYAIPLQDIIVASKSSYLNVSPFVWIISPSDNNLCS